MIRTKESLVVMNSRLAPPTAWALHADATRWRDVKPRNLSEPSPATFSMLALGFSNFGCSLLLVSLSH